MQRVAVLLAIVLSPLVTNAATFGPETPVAPVGHGLAIGEQVAASLACNGQSCLTLWSQQDNRLPGLFSSVIDGDGSVQPAGSNLLRPGIQGAPSLVWTGDHYLAVWNDGETRSLVAAPLSRDGLLTGAVQTVTSLVLQDVSPSSLAWNGHHALVAFIAPGGFEAAILDADGHLIRSTIVLSSQPIAPAVAAAGDTFAIVWGGQAPAPAVGRNVYIERFDDNGAPIDAGPVTLASGLQLNYPTIGIASNGSQFGVAFMTAQDGTLQRLRVDRTSGAIDHLSPTLFALYNGQVVGVFWSGDDFVAYASDVDSIDTVQFTSDALRVLNVSSGFIGQPQLVQGPSGAVAIWNDPRPTNYDHHIAGAMLDRNATTIAQRDLTVSRSALPQTHPVLARSPAGALVVWEQEKGDERADIVATRLDSSGNPLDAVPIPIGAGATFTSGSVLWLGNFYLVVFPYGRSVAGKRIAASGAVLDPDPIVLVADGSESVLATNGTTTILAYANANSPGISLVRLNASGAVIDSQPIAITSHSGSRLAAASNGNEFVVAWMEDHTPDPEATLNRDIYAVRLAATGLPMDASPIPVANINYRDETAPAVASDGRDFLIAYSDALNLGNEYVNLAMKRLLREGTVIDAGSIKGFAVTAPRVAFQASRYVVTWTDQYLLDPKTLASEALAVTVDSTGAVVDPPFVLAQNDSLYSLDTAVAPGLVVYSRGTAAAEAGIPRLFARQIVIPLMRGRAVRH